MHSLLQCFLRIVESHPKSFINSLIFLNLITMLNWVHAYSHTRYLTSLPIFLDRFYDSLRTVSSLHKYDTRYTSKGNFHQPKVRTNNGKFTFINYVASKLWETVPTNLKRLSISSFKKRYKDHLLKCQS